MGGPGSGNFYHCHRSAKKAVVEDCLSIDIGKWRRGGFVRAGEALTGTTRWTYPSANTFAVNFAVDLRNSDVPFVQLTYSWEWGNTGKTDSASYPARLTTSTLRGGGLRWWFLCPLKVNGVQCRRRVAKLYLPPPASYFGCRACHRLTYTSSQESGKYDRHFQAMAGNLGCSMAELRRVINRMGKASNL